MARELRPPMRGRPKPADILITTEERWKAIEDAVDLNVFDLDLPDELLTPAQLQSKYMADVSLGTLEERRAKAKLNPAVKMMLDATLGLLEQPSVAQRMRRMKEVQHRLVVAGMVAADLAIELVHQGFLFDQHRADRARLGQPMDLGEECKNFTDYRQVGDYYAALAATTFTDVAIVSSGAFLALQRKRRAQPVATRVRGNEAAIIGASPLWDTAGVSVKNNNELTNRVRAFLGEPYANPKHFEARDDPDFGNKIFYTPQARQFIHSLYTPGSGCPARWIRTEPDGPTLLEHGARRIVAYLFPEGATVTPRAS